MSKLGDALRAMKIHNTHNLLCTFGDEGKDVAVGYYAPDARSVMASCTYVWSPSFKTYPAAPWYDHGRKSFTGKRSESFHVAREWASKTYGIDEWGACPLTHGTLVPKYVIDRAKQAVRRAGEQT